VFKRVNGVKHCHNSSLHIGGAATKQEVLLSAGLELFVVLCRNNIVMPVKVQGWRSVPVSCDKTLTGVFRFVLRVAGPNPLTRKAHVPYVAFQNICAGTQILPGGILRGDRNDICEQRSDLILALAQPCQNRGASFRQFVGTLAHGPEC
jgi:hypothetical protein